MIDFNTTEFLHGHTSEDTALLVPDYPYGRWIRTEIRYWIETTKHGDRFCSQTRNPKTGRWNKPKKSTYTRVMVMIREADTGYISHTGIGDWPKPEYLQAFIDALGDQLSDAQRGQLAEVIGMGKAFENVTWSIHRGERTEEEQAARQATEANVWARVRAETAKAKATLDAGSPGR